MIKKALTLQSSKKTSAGATVTSLPMVHSSLVSAISLLLNIEWLLLIVISTVSSIGAKVELEPPSVIALTSAKLGPATVEKKNIRTNIIYYNFLAAASVHY